MKTAIVTDGKYRASIAAVRCLGRAGYRVVVTQTEGDTGFAPPVFSSRYASETRWIEGKASDAGYADRLKALISEYEHPVLMCIGAVSLNTVSKNRESFIPLCDFLIAEPGVLDALNDKEAVHERALSLGIPVPEEYTGEPDAYPVIIKPHCGEKFDLKAQDRYVTAHNAEEYAAAMEKMRRYDPEPIVQRRISGDGMGVSLLMDGEGRPVRAICHRRIREYPISGGPSTCCESFYDEAMVQSACRLLSSFGFTGMAMVEFKGDCVLEVNPRIWGSFPMTECAGSDFSAAYAAAASGEKPGFAGCNYKLGAKMRFSVNDALATVKYLLSGNLRKALGGIADFFRVREALRAKDDRRPFRRYLRGVIFKR